jgi:hypothetical protein
MTATTSPASSVIAVVWTITGTSRPSLVVRSCSEGWFWPSANVASTGQFGQISSRPL